MRTMPSPNKRRRVLISRKQAIILQLKATNHYRTSNLAQATVDYMAVKSLYKKIQDQLSMMDKLSSLEQALYDITTSHLKNVDSLLATLQGTTSAYRHPASASNPARFLPAAQAPPSDIMTSSEPPHLTASSRR